MGKIFCDQWCGTAIHWVHGIPHNDRDGKPHKCTMAQRAKEFEGYYNMIQINRVREQVKRVERELVDARSLIQVRLSNVQMAIDGITHMLDWQEEQNKPLAQAFIKRKEAGRRRNYNNDV